MRKLHPAIDKMWLYWVCILIVIAMLCEFIVSVVITGLTIACGWWVLKKAIGWLLPRQEPEVPVNVAAFEAAKEVTPTHTVFR